MFDILLRKRVSPVFNRYIPVVLKLSYSDNALTRSLPRLKAITDRDFYRKDINEFEGNFIENLFINKFQERVLEYPEIDTLDELNSVKRQFFLAQKLIAGLSESKELAPVEVELKNAVATLKNFELIGFKMPRIQNGFGFLQSEYTFLQEALGLDPSLSKTVSEFEDFGVHLINIFGSEEQKGLYLNKLITGEMTASCAHIESGNFVSFETNSLNTSASLSADDQSFTISGTKTWVYNAQSADLFIVLANVTSNSGNKELKPTLFLVEKDIPGIEIHEPVKTMGLKSLKISDVSFNNIVVSASSVLGKVGEGDIIIRKLLSQGKLSNGGHCLPIMRKFINKSVEHCIYNVFFKRDKSEKDYFRIKIGKMISRYYAVESMTYLLTGRLDTHKDADVFLESLIIKIFASETLQFIVQQAIEILGREFFMSDDELVQLSKDSLFYFACDDSNDHLRLILSAAGVRYALKSTKEGSFLEKLQRTFTKQHFLYVFSPEDELRRKNVLYGYLHQMFTKEAAILEDCVFSLFTCTQYLIHKYRENVFERHLELTYLADMAINIYAMLATLARASRAYCIGVKFQEVDRTSAEAESRVLYCHVRALRDCILKCKGPDAEQIGSHIVNSNYSELHPVYRNLMIRN